VATHTHTTPRPAAILGDVLAALVVVRVSEAGISPTPYYQACRVGRHWYGLAGYQAGAGLIWRLAAGLAAASAEAILLKQTGCMRAMPA